MHDRLVSRRIDALHQCFLVVCCFFSSQNVVQEFSACNMGVQVIHIEIR